MTAEEKIEALGVTFSTKGWQDVIAPALNMAIAASVHAWSSGQRVKGEEAVTDEGLKQRVVALKWMQAWEANRKLLVDQVEAVRQNAEATEPANDTRGPY